MKVNNRSARTHVEPDDPALVTDGLDVCVDTARNVYRHELAALSQEAAFSPVRVDVVADDVPTVIDVVDDSFSGF